MSQYSIAVYLIQVRQKGNVQNPNLILRDLDNSGTKDSLEYFIDFFQKLITKKELKNPSDPTRVHSVESVKKLNDDFFLVSIKPGVKGVTSSINSTNGNNFNRVDSDTEYIKLRHLIYLPKNKATGLIFAERVGLHGSITFVRSRLVKYLSILLKD